MATQKKRTKKSAKTAKKAPKKKTAQKKTAQKKTAQKKRGAKTALREGPFEAATVQSTRSILNGLHELYPDADCELDWNNPFELLIATVLSAQSTDRRVNEVTPGLFARWPDPAALAAADREALEQEIRSTGFFRQKAKSVQGCAQRIVDDFRGEVPQTVEDLISLPGVARKTANVVLGTAFAKATGVVVDTHVKRLAYRFGFSEETDPVKVERDLMTAWPREEWIFGAHATIWHGRRVCDARRPQCEACTLRSHCPRNGLG